VISPDGLGDLLIGDPIQTALATYDPQGCLTQERIDRGVSPDDPRLATWVPNYPTFEGGRGTTRPFVLYPSQGNDPLTHVFVYSPEISTSRSVHVGSTEAEVVAAYPDAPYADGGIGGNSRAYGIEGERGRLVIEVQNPDQESPGGRIVWAIRAETLDRPLGTLAATGAGVFCSLED
jgi:hypothetical protein